MRRGRVWRISREIARRQAGEEGVEEDVGPAFEHYAVKAVNDCMVVSSMVWWCESGLYSYLSGTGAVSSLLWDVSVVASSWKTQKSETYTKLSR